MARDPLPCGKPQNKFHFSIKEEPSLHSYVNSEGRQPCAFVPGSHDIVNLHVVNGLLDVMGKV
jgi:hypothetical protein